MMGTSLFATTGLLATGFWYETIAVVLLHFLWQAFAVAVIVVMLLLRWLGGPGHGGTLRSSPHKTPLDILKERFDKVAEYCSETYEIGYKMLWQGVPE